MEPFPEIPGNIIYHEMLNTIRKPAWLDKKIDFRDCRQVEELLSGTDLNTVCQEARCPNISECFSRKTATFLILGDTCTRGCAFCAVKKGVPKKIDPAEAKKVAEAVRKLGLRYAVITSVTRDDLIDGGAAGFARTIRAIRKIDPDVLIETLIPDFQGDSKALKKVICSRPNVIAHNLETVPRLYPLARPQAVYQRSLILLQSAKIYGKIYTKSGLMLGLGEEESEVLDVFRDLRRVRCDFLSLGQYLSPGSGNLPVREYLSPDKFADYRKAAMGLGFLHVASSPYTRSSYLADEYLANKKGVEL